MIGKVIRGANAGGLLRYLYGPGKANEHTDPHLVAGFGDPRELEPDQRPDGSRDLRRLTGLLSQPLGLLPGGSGDKPVWHCSIRAAPEDRMLSDAEWGQVAAGIMDRTGFAPTGDDFGVRWVAVRHAPDHIHIVATLARQDGGRVKTWNDYFRVREACQDAEGRLGLRSTGPADRTAAKRPTRAETEQAARRGWSEAPRVSLRRESYAAAAGASSEQEFFARLEQARVLVRKRRSTINPGEVTGYAVGLAGHTTRDGGIIWYGGGKLAADLTLPKLRARWTGPAEERFGQPLHGVMARAVLRNRVTAAADQAQDETGFFAKLREAGVLVRPRFSEINPGEVTGYAVTLPGHTGPDGAPRWYGGGRLADGLTLPQLRRRWNQDRTSTGPRAGSFRFTTPEREAFYL
ncbi:MAG: relaxase/mobilization nuclease domain-containing protein, partial [Streptosporangiales bacterium]